MHPFKQSKYYTRGRGGRSVSQIFMHTLECQKTMGVARRVWLWFTGRNSPQASVHFIVDYNTTYQSVNTQDTAWAVDQWERNTTSISIELAGYAAQTPAEWSDDYSKIELVRAARLVAEIAKEYHIPIVKLTPEQVFHGDKGIAGHWDVTQGYHIYGGHTDPGKSFPWESFLKTVEGFMV